MFTMSYVNGYYPVSVTCYHERFHNCNACTYRSGNFIVFQSYQTPIAAFDGEYLYFNEYYNCSAATRKQFSRWLRENNLPSYGWIRDTFESERVDGLFCDGEFCEHDSGVKVVSLNMPWFCKTVGI